MTTILLILTLISPTGSGDTLATEIMTPWNRAVGTPKGQLKNPYPALASIAKEGHRKYMAAGCNGCHGGGGGGGMAAPLTNPIWIYGDDDDTLFRVIALGTGSLSPGNAFGKLGYRRKGSEAVVGPMPDFGTIIKTDDDLWKIIAWIRSVNCGQQVSGCESTVGSRWSTQVTSLRAITVKGANINTGECRDPTTSVCQGKLLAAFRCPTNVQTRHEADVGIRYPKVIL